MSGNNKSVKLSVSTVSLLDPAKILFIETNKEFRGHYITNDHIIRQALHHFLEHRCFI